MIDKELTEKFLDLYKQLEAVVKSTPAQSVLNYEQTLSSDDMDRMRICRQIRNYIQHHSDGKDFLAVSEPMVNFIQTTIYNVKNEQNSHVRHMQPILYHQSISEIQVLFSKSQMTWLPVVDNNNVLVGVLDMFQFIRINSSHGSHSKLLSCMSKEDFLPFSVIEDSKKNIEAFTGTDAVIVNNKGEYVGVYQ